MRQERRGFAIMGAKIGKYLSGIDLRANQPLGL